MANSELTHWQRSIQNLRDIYNRFGTHATPEAFVKLRESVGDPHGQFRIEIQYLHPRLGNRQDHLILFSDGTWRIEVW